MEGDMGKTPSYVKAAVDNYRKQYDFVQVRLPKGSLRRLRERFGKGVNAHISKLVLDDLERLEKESDLQIFEHTVEIDQPSKQNPDPKSICEFPKDNFDDLKAGDWIPEKHRGKVPYPPQGTSDDATWDSGTQEWYDPLSFS